MKSQSFSAYCTHKLKNVNNILHLVQKYAPVFVCEHHLLQDACQQFPGSKAPGKHRGKCMRDSSISHIVMPNGGYCVYCPSNIFGKVFMTSWLFAMWNFSFSIFCRTTLWTNKHILCSVTTADCFPILN